MVSIDLNCDLGESFGRYQLGEDAAMMALISSANVACGFHAGDPDVMTATISLAKQNGVALGAHPGYPDLQGFGRRDMALSGEEITNAILYQLGALSAFAQAAEIPLVHVKPHGALYNRAARDPIAAAAIARAVRQFNPELILVGLAGSALVRAGQEESLATANEGFPDRAYLPDGSLMPRSQNGAVITEPELVAQNALKLALEGISIAGERISIDTLCLHGDNLKAVANARAIRTALEEADIAILPLSEI